MVKNTSDKDKDKSVGKDEDTGVGKRSGVKFSATTRELIAEVREETRATLLGIAKDIVKLALEKIQARRLVQMELEEEIILLGQIAESATVALEIQSLPVLTQVKAQLVCFDRDIQETAKAFNYSGMATGRMSSKNPNMSNYSRSEKESSYRINGKIYPSRSAFLNQIES